MTPRPLEEYEFLSGTGVLAEGAQEKCLSGDQFLISRRQLQVENPAWWFSRRLQYSDLSARIADDLSARFGFKSMAYEDEDDYALSGHTHSEYNYVRLVSPFADSPDSEYDKVLLVSIDGKRKWVKVPRQRIMPPPDPVPGQIKLMAVTSLQPIDAMGRNFDGWVYADGQTYPPVFEHASYFEQVDGGFRVPDMRNMFEMNNRPYEDVGFGLKDAENDVSPHAHNMALKFT